MVRGEAGEAGAAHCGIAHHELVNHQLLLLVALLQLAIALLQVEDLFGEGGKLLGHGSIGALHLRDASLP